MLELRPADLPGLHDADAGRHALPGVLAAKTKVRTCATIHGDPSLTYVLIAINVLLFLGSSRRGGSRGTRVLRPVLCGRAAVADGEWWRLVTGGFLHAGHFGSCTSPSTCTSSTSSGTLLEPSSASGASARIYFASLLAGAFGASAVGPSSSRSAPRARSSG